MGDNHAPFLDEFKHLLDRICKDAAELLHAQASSIFLRRADEDVFVMRAAHGYSYTLIDRAEYRPGEGITGWVAQDHTYRADSRKQVTSHPSHLGKYDKEIWGDDPEQCRSMVAIPLYVGRKVYGIIKVENKRRGKGWGRFTPEDLDRLGVYIRAISHAIESNDALLSVLGRLSVFVLMPFAKQFDDVFKCGIAPAAQDAGMRCERIDAQHFTGEIVRRIYQNIAHADIIVSVTTGKNPNVFYETGYSHALGKPTIPLAEHVGDIPFDLRPYPHLIYSRRRIADLKIALQKRLTGIRADVLAGAGHPPHSRRFCRPE